jgi:hypothetical protein
MKLNKISLFLTLIFAIIPLFSMERKGRIAGIIPTPADTSQFTQEGRIKIVGPIIPLPGFENYQENPNPHFTHTTIYDGDIVYHGIFPKTGHAIEVFHTRHQGYIGRIYDKETNTQRSLRQEETQDAQKYYFELQKQAKSKKENL